MYWTDEPEASAPSRESGHGMVAEKGWHKWVRNF